MMIKHPFLVSLLTASALSLTGCMNMQNPYTDHQQLNKTTKGAAVGAGTGASVVGMTASTAAAGATTAGIGALVGGVVGYHLDKKDVALRNELRAAGIRVVDPDDGKNDIKLVMPSNITFKEGSSALSPEFKTRLNAVAKVLKHYKFAVAEVPGYTDSIGSKAYNMRLSAARAQAVVDYLAAQGIAANRLTAVAHGESDPAATNGTANGRALNRRVEIILHQPQRTV